MPKSKRNKVVTLSKTDKKTREHKSNLFDQIRESVDSFDFVYLFRVENMRNTFMKEVRNEWKDSAK